VVDDENREVMEPLEFPEKGKEFGHIPGVVLVAPMKAYERIEQEEPGTDPLDGLFQPNPILFEVEPEGWHGDDVEGNVLETESTMLADPGQPFADAGRMIFGEVDEDLPWIPDLEPIEAGSRRRHREREIEPKPRLAQLRMSGQEAHGRVAPERLDEPTGFLLGFFEIPHSADR
jgi:hypothetical protein